MCVGDHDIRSHYARMSVGLGPHVMRVGLPDKYPILNRHFS